ncbi:GDP-mannose transporter GONST4 [Spatholobus suberectus]|nr:GDP-mannose transporter GONST4 [Spatholobus suberectus]
MTVATNVASRSDLANTSRDEFLTRENVKVLTIVRSGSFNFAAFSTIALSCLFDLLIRSFGFAMRRAVFEIAFTVIRVVNKFLTVAINVMIWDKHASPIGLVYLLFTIVGGILYQ